MPAYIELTNSFADGTTRKLELGPFETDATVVNTATLKSNIAAVNSDTSVLGSLYLSAGGASFSKITGAVVDITTKREINLND